MSRARKENDLDGFLQRQNCADRAEYEAKKIEEYKTKVSLATWFPKQWMSIVYFGEPARYREKEQFIAALCKPVRQDTDGVLKQIRGTASKHARHAVDLVSNRSESPALSSAEPASALKKYSITLEESNERKAELIMKRNEREISLLQELISDETDPDVVHGYQLQLKAARAKLLNRIRNEDNLLYFYKIIDV